MTRSEPHPQRCETCESFHEMEQPRRYRCSWNYCDVQPKDECPCRPSHWKEASRSASEPVRHCDDCNIIELLQFKFHHQFKQEREKVLDELAEPTIRASEEAEQNGDYISQTCYEDVLKWIAAIRQQEVEP